MTDSPWKSRAAAGIAALCIVLQFPGDLVLSLAALALWLATLAVLDRPALARLNMPRFWAVTLILGVGSGLLLGTRDREFLGVRFSEQGLQAGALMVARGALIFGLASWASRAVGVRRVRRFFARLGLEPLGGAFSVALGLLPDLRERLKTAREPDAVVGLADARAGGRLDRWLEPAVRMVVSTAQLADDLATRGESGRRARIFAVVGSPGTGKTTAVLAVVDALKARGLVVGGVIQPAETQGFERLGYRLQDVDTGETRSFVSRAPDPPPDGPRFVFDAGGWDWGRGRIERARQQADVLVVDELGRLEAQGEGHLPALGVFPAGERAHWWVLGVRRDAAEPVRRWLGRFDEMHDASADRSDIRAIVDRALAVMAVAEGPANRRDGESDTGKRGAI